MWTFARILAVAALAAAWGCGGEDDKPAAEQVGAFLGDQTAKLAKGIGDGLAKDGDQAGESLAKGGAAVLGGAGAGLAANGEQAGSQVAEGVGNVLKGALEGLDAALQIRVDPGSGLDAAGVAVARGEAKPAAAGGTEIDLYLALAKPFAGALKLDVLDGGGVKYGSARATVEGAAGATVVAAFVFPAESKAGFPGLRYVLNKAE